MSSRNDSTNDGPLPATRVFNRKGATEALREEIRRYGLPDQDREAQMLCRLAFSVCPPREYCVALNARNGWMDNVDETWVCRHLGMKTPSARGKVIACIMRDLMHKLDDLRGADTVLHLCVKEQGIVVKSVSPRPLIDPYEPSE